LQTRNIGGTLAGIEECSALYKQLVDTDLLYVLRRSGLHTFFAPLNAAVGEHGPEELEKLLDGSMLPGALETFDLRRCKTVRTEDGEVVPVAPENGSLRVGGALIVRSDIPCTNGVVHIVDGLVAALEVPGRGGAPV
jgi:uncharacterized surface protein with fasciclin (FAS1) repeats